MFKTAPYRNFLIIAGEASGDLIGGSFMKAVKKIDPEFAFWGIGGGAMQDAGQEQLFSARDLGVTGFTEVLFRLPGILRILNRINREAGIRKPAAAVLIDYPDFNLHLARRLKKQGVPVLYYVSPQMWAWRPGRVKTIQSVVDRMMVLFPFEESWYKERGVDACFVGHPVIDRIEKIPGREECRRQLGIQDKDFLIAILPGSRMNEVISNLPIMIRSAEALSGQEHNHQPARTYRFLLPLADTVARETLTDLYPFGDIAIEIVQGSTLKVMRAADFAWVASGTAALETALLGTPHIVVYRMSPLTHYLAKRLVKIPFISIANIMAGEKFIPELIQKEFTVDRLLAETLRITESSQIYGIIKSRLNDMYRQFGGAGASDRAADVFIESLSRIECGDHS